MGFNRTAAMFIPMRVKTFVCNIVKRLKARARGPKGCKIYCFNQHGRRVIKANVFASCLVNNSYLLYTACVCSSYNMPFDWLIAKPKQKSN